MSDLTIQVQEVIGTCVEGGGGGEKSAHWQPGFGAAAVTTRISGMSAKDVACTCRVDTPSFTRTSESRNPIMRSER